MSAVDAVVSMLRAFDEQSLPRPVRVYVPLATFDAIVEECAERAIYGKGEVKTVGGGLLWIDDCEVRGWFEPKLP